MTSLWFLFWGSFVIGLSGAMMPGPVLTATVSEVMKRGFSAGPLIVLGHGVIEVAVLIGVVAGLGHWLVMDPIKGALGLLGGSLLILMGTHTSLTARHMVEKSAQARAAPRAALHGPVLAGIITTLSNPYFYIWWATIGLTYASLSLERGGIGLASFYAGHILADLAWYSLVAAALVAGRRVCPPAVHRAVIVLCGIILIGLGLAFIRTGMATINPPT